MVKDAYSGVNISLGDAASRTAYGWAQQTFPFRDLRFGMPVTGLGGSFANLMSYGQVRIAMTSDGVGTKVELAERTGIWDSLGFDLVAMVVDDLAAIGAEPTNLSNILDVDRVDVEVVDALMKGLYEAAKLAEVAVVGGEIAELGSRVGGWGDGVKVNWSATGIGVVQMGQSVLDGSAVVPGDAVIAIESRGFRSNGFSLLRRIMAGNFGDDWHLAMCAPPGETQVEALPWGKLLLTPSRIFSPWVVALRQQEFELHTVTHVTGGGVPGNLARSLRPSGCGAILDDLPKTPWFMKRVQELGDISDERAWRQWNMGTGLLLTVAGGAGEATVARLRALGAPARIAGKTTDTPGITIQTDRGELVFEREEA